MPDHIVCRHIEVIDSSTHIGACKRCGQQVQWDEYEREIIRILKPGSLNGVQTLVRPPALAKEERKAPAAPPAAPPPLPKTTPAPAPEPAPAASATPKLSKQWKKRLEYLEQHRAEMVHDYHNLTLRKFFKKWHISSAKWPELKLLWNIKSKGRRNRYMQPKVETKPSVVETKETVDETPPPVIETPGEPFISKPLNKRSGVRAIRNF